MIDLSHFVGWLDVIAARGSQALLIMAVLALWRGDVVPRWYVDDLRARLEKVEAARAEWQKLALDGVKQNAEMLALARRAT